MRDLHNSIHVSRGISPYDHGTGDAEVLTQIIDTQGFDSLEFVILTGSLADSDATFAVDMEEGDDSALSDTAAVDDKDITGTEALAGFVFSDDNSAFKLGYIGSKRYVRLGITPTDNTGAALLAVAVIQGHPANAPTSNPPD